MGQRLEYCQFYIKIYDNSTRKKNKSTLNLVVNQMLIYMVLQYICGKT